MTINRSCNASLSLHLTLKLPWLYCEKLLLFLEGKSFSRSAAISSLWAHAHHVQGKVEVSRSKICGRGSPVRGRGSKARDVQEHAGLHNIRCYCSCGAPHHLDLLLMVGISGRRISRGTCINYVKQFLLVIINSSAGFSPTSSY